MSPEPKSGYRWLDSLARWSAGGSADAHAPAARDGEVSVVAGGTTRRTALRTAVGAGAIAVLAPMRLLQPSIAGAATTQLTQCSTDSFEKVRADFQACVKEPLSDFERFDKGIAEYEDFLREVKRPAGRKRIMKKIKELTRRRARALKDLEFCNAAFVQDRAEGEAQCQAANPPPGEGGGTGGSGGCEAGYVLCGSYCCNTAYAFCEGCNGTPICCRIDGACCPSG
ncbi:MAG TPA: hypothetical protein VJ257_04000 [Solirubrobacterales bacterium]|nr:hypothetical protein [Solirubrobacterales bacterium]